ncbi:MAG: toll/interleukin-1 receptor domain-containing protein [Candidatus Thiodiazotropha endolucinida]
MAIVFFSYSHRDEELRDEVEAALSPLRRQGFITAWHDRRISPGTDFDNKIGNNLEHADIILLLVSNYFINSDYIYGKELERAMQRHEHGEARVIPIILRHADWQDLPFGKLLALPPDGRPITAYPDIHEALALISRELRKTLSDLGLAPTPAKAGANPAYSVGPDDKPHAYEFCTEQEPRSSNLRIRKTFTDQERDDFLDYAFGYIAHYFENSLEELKHRNSGADFRLTSVGENRFTATLYRDGSTIGECIIWRSDSTTFSNGIAYSAGRTDATKSFNEILSVDDDGYTLSLAATIRSYRLGSQDMQLTPQGASEYLWGMFIEPLQ